MGKLYYNPWIFHVCNLVPKKKNCILALGSFRTFQFSLNFWENFILILKTFWTFAIKSLNHHLLLPMAFFGQSRLRSNEGGWRHLTSATWTARSRQTTVYQTLFISIFIIFYICLILAIARGFFQRLVAWEYPTRGGEAMSTINLSNRR